MKSIVYCYTNPLLESVPDPSVWGMAAARVYYDLGDRQQWEQLLAESQLNPPDSLVVRRWDDLGESMKAVGDRLAALERLGIALIVLEESTDPQSPALMRSQMIQACQRMQAAQGQRIQ